MKRIVISLAALMVLAGTAGCGEQPQSLQSSKSDVPAFEGAEGPFVASGWKVGDKASWEQSLKARMLNGQNEYIKLPLAK